MKASLPPDEANRLEALRQYDILDTAPEQAFDDLAHLAAHICGTPLSAITLVDQERQWFKSRVGPIPLETHRDVAFCAHAILGPDLLLVPDTTADVRFADNPFVTAEPHVRFYAGVPLVTPEGQAIGTLCVIDTVPRQLNPIQQEALRRLGRQTIALLEARPNAATEKRQSRQDRRQADQQQLMLTAETARQDADRLKISELRYRRLFETAKDGMLILDAATGKIEDVNPFLCQLLGYESDYFLDKQLWEIGTFRDIVANQDAFRTLQEKEYIRYDDLPLETKDGQSTSVEFVSNVYMCAEKQVIQCNIRDIRERKRAVAAELELQRFLQATLDALASHIAVLDETGRIIAVNKAWRQFAAANGGTPSSCGVGANYLEVCDGARGAWAKSAPVVAQGIREVMAGQHEAFCLEYSCHSPREERWFNVCVTRFAGSGPLYVAVAHENITERKLAEQALQQSEQEQRQLAQRLEKERERLVEAQAVAKLGSWELDLATNALTWSDENYRIFGIDRDKFGASYEAFLECIHPDDRAAVDNAYIESVANHTPYTMDHRLKLEDDSLKIVQERCQTFYDDQGQPIRSVGTTQDITERRLAEQALAATTREIVTIWESMTDAFFSLDRQWRFTHMNPQTEHLWHRHAAELLGKNIWEEFPAIQGLKFDTEYHRAMEERVAVSFEEFYPPDNAWREVHAYPSSIGLSVYFRDISERKQDEAALARLAAIVEFSSDAIISWNLDGIITSWNAGAEILYGYTPQETLGVSISMLIGSNRLDEITQLLNRIRQGEYVANYETVRVCKDGRHVDVALTLSPINNAAGEMIGASAITRDISARKQAEHALRASEERFRAFMDNTPVRVFMQDREGRLVYLNRAVEQFRQAPASELLGQTVFDRFPLHIAEMLHQSDLQVFRSGQPQQFEEAVPSFDGHLHHEVVVKFILHDANGQQLLAGVAVDVTKQKRAEIERDRFFMMSLDLLSIAGLDGYFKRVNPAFTEALGFTEAEILAKPFSELSHPDDLAATLAVVETLSAGNPVIGFENRYRTKDGSWRWLEWKSVAVVEEGLIYAAARDVTQRKEAEATLRQMRDELEIRVAERTAELAQANAELQVQIAEREGAETEIRTRARQQAAVAELGHRALSNADMDTLLNGATTLVQVTLDVERSTILELLPGGATLRFRAGPTASPDTNSYLALINANSQANYALLSNTPIIVTDLRTETRFEPSSLLLKQGMVSGITVIVGGYEQPFGILGAYTTRQRHFTQDDVHFLQAISNVLAVALERNRIETEIHQLNVTLKETNERLRLENIDRQMALGALREVTTVLEQAKAEAEGAKENAELANRAKSEFLSRMSHELRTPLNAILGFGQILDKQDLAPLSKESVGYILKGGRHLLDLINEVLDIARVEAGRLELSLEPVALNDIVPEACALVRPLATEHNISLAENASKLGSDYILADRQRLKQVLINLLANAIKYNREAGQVEVLCNHRPDGWTAIAVRDTGPGISPQDLPKLFTPFERLHASTSAIEGTGLGLVLSQRLVTAMGGTLNVASTLGQGTTFTIELPQATSPQEQLTNVPAGSPHLDTAHVATRLYSVLCIEDNPSNLRLMEAIFEDRPEITLLSAMQGSVGLDLARQHEPDLILLDLNLPDMHGKEVLTRLQQSALTRDIPVVVVSADATSHQIERLLTAGAKAYLTKPVDVGQFLHTVDKFLQPTPAIVMQPAHSEESK